MLIHYLAYGSNLHPHRLLQRVPSARLVGVTRLPGRELRFQKKSFDGSAKCMYVESGSATSALFAAVYQMDRSDKPALDAIEGLDRGYDEQPELVAVNGARIQTFTYAAATTHIAPDLMPYHWYKELVVLGARYHFFPDDYVAAIAATASIADPDATRRDEKEALLRAMRAANQERGAATA